MNKKQLILLGIVLGVLVLGVVFKKFHKSSAYHQPVYTSLHVDFKNEDVEKINITKGGGSPIELVRTEKVWRIPSLFNARADDSKIETLFQTLKKCEGDVRASDDSLDSDFGISDDQAFKINLFSANGKEVLGFSLGAVRSDYEEIFIRKLGEKTVYSVSQDLFQDIGIFGDPKEKKLEAGFWAHLNPFGPISSAQKMEIQKMMSGQPVLWSGLDRMETGTAEKKQSTWKFIRANNPFDIDPEKVDVFLKEVSGWAAQSIASPDHLFENADWIFLLTLTDGKTLQAWAKKDEKDQDTYYLKTNLEDTVYQVSRFKLETILVDDSHFYVSNPLRIDDSITQIVIHAKNETMSLRPKEQKTEEVYSYVNNLKALVAEKLLLEDSQQELVKPEGDYWVRIEKDKADPYTIDFGNILPGDSKAYAAKMRTETVSFAVQEYLFKDLFDFKIFDKKSNSK